MKWSWRIGRLAGIDLRVHATFVLLIAWLALAEYQASGTAAAAARGVLFTLAIFGSVVLHEFGHALVARRFGVGTRDITLLPIGGVARLEKIPRDPRQELWIALAGPAVTLGLVVAFYVVLRVAGLPMTAPGGVSADRDPFLARLLWVNATLLVFNLLPAFPMDGGRVLRAALALRRDYLQATELAARVGRAFALLFGIVGLFYNPFLVLIALFVWLGAAGEASEVQMRSSLEGVSVERVMIRDVQTLGPQDPLDAALRHILAGFQQDFPVVEDGKVVGVLTRAALLKGLAEHGRDARVAQAMERTFVTAEPQEPVEQAVARLRECRCRTLPVVADEHLRGVLTLDNVGEYVMIDAALRGSAVGSKSA
jgi:Zn-dependent protease